VVKYYISLKTTKEVNVKNKQNLGYNIISRQAKDFYFATLGDNATSGYDIYNLKGEINKKLFKAVFDYSLDLIELENCYKNVFKNNRFAQTENDFIYTLAVINVKFDKGLKEFYLTSDNVYVKSGYKLSDCQLNNCVCIKNQEVVAIKLLQDCKCVLQGEKLPKYFIYENGKYVLKGEIKTLKTTYELREYFYQNGFYCNGNKYVRYKRSSGSSREGNCLFILQELYGKMEKWSRCGLPKFSKGKYGFLASLEAYSALSLSGIEKTISLEPNHILILEDKQSIFKEKAVVVTEENGKVKVEQKETEISNNVWDGEGLLDVSVFKQNGYIDKGMMVLRGRFFKTCAFNTNLQQWFKDNNITSVSQLNGETFATDISQIKLVVTKSSLKYLKFGTSKAWRENVGNIFGVVKTDKPTHYFNGRMVRTNYQILNTLKLSLEEVKALLKDSLEYLERVRFDSDVLRYHIKYAFKTFDYSQIETFEDVVWIMLGTNEDFRRTTVFKKFIKNLITAMKNKIKSGQILVGGTYATLFGNGYELLCETIFDSGNNLKILSNLKQGQIMTKFFDYNKLIVGARSPHVTMGNLYLPENAYCEKIDKYFNLSKEIVYVNAIGENLQQRLNGCDYDSDTMLLTDNAIMVDSVSKIYKDFLVPVYQKQDLEETVEQENNFKELATLDYKIQNNKVGEIINLSQLLNSVYWDRQYSGKQNLTPLYNDICILAVLSGLEIDKAKRISKLNVSGILEEVRQRNLDSVIQDNKKIYPTFFKEAVFEQEELKGKKDVSFKYFNTVMDYVYKVAKEFTLPKRKLKNMDIIDVIYNPQDSNRGGYQTVHKLKVLDIVRDYQNQINELRAELSDKDADKRKILNDISLLEQKCVLQVEPHVKNPYTVYLIFKEIDKKENSKISNLLLFSLIKRRNREILKMLKESRDTKFLLEEVYRKEDSEFRLFDFYFVKKLLQKST